MSQPAEIPDFSRKPDDYRPDPGGHFRGKKRERDFPPTAIRRCIESGEVTDWDGSKLRLTAEYIGWTFHVVVRPKDGIAVTCYPEDDSWYK